MEYIDRALEKIKEWIDRVLDALFGPESQHEPEPIPIPVSDHKNR